MEQTWVPVASIVVDERRKRATGDLEPLVKSIRQHGLADPIIVTTRNRLVSGWRRLQAAKQLGKVNIEAYIVDNAIDAVGLIVKEGINPKYFKPLSWSERIAIAYVIEDLDASRREMRKANSRRRAAAIAHGREPDHEKARGPNTAELISGLFECSQQTYRRARTVYDAAHNLNLDDETRGRAQKALEFLDETGQPAGAYNMYVNQDGRFKPSQRVTKSGQTTTEQRGMLTEACNMLTGLKVGLQQVVELNPDLTDEEVTRWVNDLSSARKEIERLIKSLRKVGK